MRTQTERQREYSVSGITLVKVALWAFINITVMTAILMLYGYFRAKYGW